MQRSAGIILPLFSLPSPYGIGSIGKEARAFADFLKKAGQSWWQVLPLGPTGAGDSPYTSLSTFAGNPLFIDLETLVEDGLLDTSDLEKALVPQVGKDEKKQGKIDYGALYEVRLPLLRKAFDNITAEMAEAARNFRDNTPWVREYALYQALKEHFGGTAWYDWSDKSIKCHEAQAVEHWNAELAEQIAYHVWEQYYFFKQWEGLKKYVNDLGVKIIGDIPIYVSLDSSDVWSESKQFLLDEEGKPAKVAGVPPDYFSEDGQRWGNPLYNWDVHRKDGFGWWIRRIEGASKLFDAIRIDHFRAFESYWAIPAECESAKDGKWEKGPGMDLLKVLTDWFPHITYIAEDLGILTDAVHDLRNQSGLPGMKVLEFAFSDPYNSYLPHHYQTHCLCYTGTHDNNTLAGWYAEATEKERAFVKQYLGVSEPEEVRQAVLRCGQGSVAKLFIALIQDYLGLGSEARINVPGMAEGNWRWRLAPDALTDTLAEEIFKLTETYSRCYRETSAKSENEM